MQFTELINIDALGEAVDFVMEKVERAEAEVDVKLFKNTIDPFSAVFDALRQEISLDDWMKQEKGRQIQKTLQNAIGVFHQKVLGSFPGWEDLGTGEIVDIVNRERGIVAEIKNKHNTTKGNHKTQIYEDLKKCITSDEYKGFTGYYVEVIPKNRMPYSKVFTPSDNRLHERLPENQNIRVIDGASFYELVTGIPNALEQLYKILPTYIAQYRRVAQTVEEEQLFWDLFKRVYRTVEN